MPRRANALSGFPLIDYFRENLQNNAASGPPECGPSRSTGGPSDSIDTSVGIADNESIDLILREAVKRTLRKKAEIRVTATAGVPWPPPSGRQPPSVSQPTRLLPGRVRNYIWFGR
jgi:hypothetical protein